MGRTFTNLHMRKATARDSGTLCGGSDSPLWKIDLRSVAFGEIEKLKADSHPCGRCLKSFQYRQRIGATPAKNTGDGKKAGNGKGGSRSSKTGTKTVSGAKPKAKKTISAGKTPKAKKRAKAKKTASPSPSISATSATPVTRPGESVLPTPSATT